MKLIVVRHGIAEDRDEFRKTGRSDEVRPLTPLGQKKMRRASRGLAKLVGKVDWLASSNLVRAQQTAAILNAQFHLRQFEKWAELKPTAKPTTLLRRLRKMPKDSVGIVVGHEPHLSRFLGVVLAPEREPDQADEHPLITLKKGAAVLLEIESVTNPQAQVRWVLQPSVLRRLAET